MGIADFDNYGVRRANSKTSETTLLLPGPNVSSDYYYLGLAVVALDNISTTTGPSNTVSASLVYGPNLPGSSITKVAEHTLGGSAGAGVTLAVFLVVVPTPGPYTMDVQFSFASAVTAKSALLFYLWYQRSNAPSLPAVEAYAFGTGSAASLTVNLSGLRASRDKVFFVARGVEGPYTDVDATTFSSSPTYFNGAFPEWDGTSGGGAASNMSIVSPGLRKSFQADAVSSISVTSTIEANRDSVQVVLSLVDGMSRMLANLIGVSSVTPMARLDPVRLLSHYSGVSEVSFGMDSVVGPSHVLDSFDRWIGGVPIPSLMVRGHDFSKWLNDQPVHGLWPTDLPPKVLIHYLRASAYAVARYSKRVGKYALTSMMALSRSGTSAVVSLVEEMFASAFALAGSATSVLFSGMKRAGMLGRGALFQSSSSSVLRSAVVRGLSVVSYRVLGSRLPGVLSSVVHAVLHAVRAASSLVHLLVPGWVSAVGGHLFGVLVGVEVTLVSGVSYVRGVEVSGRVQRVDSEAVRR